MEEFKTIKLKRLWNNIASTRDYIIRDCLLHGQGIKFILENSNEIMEIPYQKLKEKAFQTNTTLQKSRFGKNYYLIDFAWRPLKPTIQTNIQEELFK